VINVNDPGDIYTHQLVAVRVGAQIECTRCTLGDWD